MSDVQVSYYDLTRLNNQINATLVAVQSVHAQNTQLQYQVDRVDQRVDRVDRELVTLWKEFREFVKVQENRHFVSVALAKITHVRQELDQKFGKHYEARLRLRGILDTSDMELLREHTIVACSEQIMLDTPKYWLSPNLVALAAWIANNENLAKKAVKIALDRDVEKTALLWALICRRTVPQTQEDKTVANAREDACLGWLKAYFDMQNPMQMKASVIVLVDAWRQNVFGEDKNNKLKQTFANWMTIIKRGGVTIGEKATEEEKKAAEELAKKNEKEFDEKQMSSWNNYYQSFCVSTKDSYKKLAALSPEFPEADAYLMRIRSADPIQAEFKAILEKNTDVSEFINAIDIQLERLISEFDPEEEVPRALEEHYTLVDENQGDLDEVARIENDRMQKWAQLDKEESFAERLVYAVKNKDSKFDAARKTAISDEFLGTYIKAAYSKYITDKKESFPQKITFAVKALKGWDKGETVDGKNGDALKTSLKDHLNGFRQKAIDAAKATSKKVGFLVGGIISAAAGVLLGLLAHWILILLGLGLGAIFFYNMYKDGKRVQQMIDKTNAEYDKLIRDGGIFIDSILAEWRMVLAEKEIFEASNKNKLNLSEKGETRNG